VWARQRRVTALERAGSDDADEVGGSSLGTAAGTEALAALHEPRVRRRRLLCQPARVHPVAVTAPPAKPHARTARPRDAMRARQAVCRLASCSGFCCATPSSSSPYLHTLPYPPPLPAYLSLSMEAARAGAAGAGTCTRLAASCCATARRRMVPYTASVLW